MIVEIDGKSHELKGVEDFKRQKYLENLGLILFRISDIDMKNIPEQVMHNLEDFIVQNFSFK